MKKGLLGIMALLSIQCAIGQKQPAAENQQNRLEKLASFIKRNKACLSGTECNPRFSLFLNYALGTAFGIATGLVAVQTTRAMQKRSERKMQERRWKEMEQSGGAGLGRAKEGIDATTALHGPIGQYAAGWAAIFVLDMVQDMGYSALVDKTRLPEKGKIRCMIKGDNCSLAQRRRMFFNAGQTSGIFAGVALSFFRPRWGKAPIYKYVESE